MIQALLFVGTLFMFLSATGKGIADSRRADRNDSLWWEATWMVSLVLCLICFTIALLLNVV